MSYQIMYNPEDSHKYPTQFKKKHKKIILPVLMVLLCVLALGRPGIRNKVEQWLIPGDPQVTKAAFSLMLDELREGESLGDAVTTFCNEIIAGSENKTISWT